MKKIRCGKGHFYDGDRYVSCPHCASGIVPEESLRTGNNSDEKTEILKREDIVPGDSTVLLNYGNNEAIETVMGWLVGIAGNEYGKSFELTTKEYKLKGKASIEIELNENLPESFRNSVKIGFGRTSEVFYIKAIAGNVVCVNKDAVMGQQMLESGDVVSMGEIKFAFIPLCGNKFDWDKLDERI